MRRSLGDGYTEHVPVWLWRLGDTLVVGHPSEAYSDLQSGLRAAFPRYTVIVMNLVNGWTGDLLPAALYDRNIYSVLQTPFAKGSREALISRCRAEIGKIRDRRVGVCLPTKFVGQTLAELFRPFRTEVDIIRES